MRRLFGARPEVEKLVKVGCNYEKFKTSSTFLVLLCNFEALCWCKPLLLAVVEDALEDEVSKVKDSNTPHLVCDVDNAAIFLLVVNSDVACQTCLAAWDLVGQMIKTSSSSLSGDGI